MFRKLLLLSSLLLLSMSCGWSPKEFEVQANMVESNLPVTNATGTNVYLPIIAKPWLDSTFGVETSYLNDTVAMRAKESRNAWVRINALHWSSYQPNNNFEFHTDPILEQELIKAAQSGMKPILIIHRTPSWAREYPDSDCGPIRSDKLSDFADFMKKVVQKYSQPPYNVFYYELWNEPDGPLSKTPNTPWGCWGDPQAEYYGGDYYAEMLRAVTPAMKSVNSNVKIVLGGLLLDCDPADSNCKQVKMAGYFEGILRAGGGEYFDVVNFHAYNYYAPGTSPIQREYEIPNWAGLGGQVEGKLQFLRQVLTKYGMNKPIILSEAGLLCTGCATFPVEFEQHKAEYVVWLYARNWAKGISATTWYTLDKAGWRGSGLLDRNNNPLPAFHAYKTMTGILYGADFVQEIDPSSGVKIFEFDHNSKILVLFATNLGVKTIDLSGYGLNFEAVDLYGNACGAEASDCSLAGSQLTFDLPVFIRFDD